MRDGINGDLGDSFDSVRPETLPLQAARPNALPGIDFVAGWVPDGRPLFNVQFGPNFFRPTLVWGALLLSIHPDGFFEFVDSCAAHCLLEFLYTNHLDHSPALRFGSLCVFKMYLKCIQLCRLAKRAAKWPMFEG